VALRACLIALAALVPLGCGGERDQGERAARSPLEPQLASAARVAPGDFPAVGGRTLQQIADTAKAGPQVGLATSVFVPGINRIAFGLIDPKGSFLYGKTAVYLAPTPRDRARGPFPAPADSLLVRPPYRSRGAAEEDAEIAAIYSTQVRLPRAGRYAALMLTQTAQGALGAPTQITVAKRTPVPARGEPAPRVATDTLASAGGSIKAIDTRDPPDDMHDLDLRDVVGRRPVALLFATPALCESRVCGPVTDIAQQLKADYRDRVAFIHQEVYRDNDPRKGLRPPLEAFGLRSEPWLFTIDRDGRVAARLEGSFGLGEFRRALDAALR